MSFTYSTLKTAIGEYLECSETTFTNNLPTFIKESEDRILKMVQLPEQRKNVQGETATNSRFLACPSDFLAPMSLAIISSNTYDYLDMKHASFLKEYSPSTSVTGQPKYYAVFSKDSFTLAPIPDPAYTVELHYPDALLYGSLVEGAIFLKESADIIAQFEMRFKEAISRMKNLSEGRDTRDEYRYDSLRGQIT